MAGPTIENLGDENRILYSGVFGAGRAGWKIGVDAKEPLPDFIQEYTKDLLTWFHPRQGWQATEVRLGLLNPASIRRVAAAAAVTSEAGAETRKGDGASEELSPDMMHLIYFLKAANPPLKRGGGLDIKRVISPNFDGEVNYPDGSDATVELWPKKLGTSYRLPEALKELSNTFYVQYATAYADWDHSNRPPAGPSLEYLQELQRTQKYPRDIRLMITLRNLYTQMEQEERDLQARANRLRAKRGEIETKLGIEVADPAATRDAKDSMTKPSREKDRVDTGQAESPTKPRGDEKETKIDKGKKEEGNSKQKLEPGVYRISVKRDSSHHNEKAATIRIDEPPVGFADIGGLTEIKGALRLLVAGLKNPNLFTKWGTRTPRGILFHGLPGTGKTMTAKALANEAGVPFFLMEYTDVASRWIDEGTENLKAILGELDKIEGRKIVFIDEFDNIAPSRANLADGSGASARSVREILNPLLEYIDGFRSTRDITFVASTNRIEDIDEAMLRPGRFDRHYHIRPPQGVELIEVYRKQIARAEKEAGRSLFNPEVDFDTLMRQSKGFTGADIAEIIRRVLENKVAGELQGESQEDVTTDNLVKELKGYERKKQETPLGFQTKTD